MDDTGLDLPPLSSDAAEPSTILLLQAFLVQMDPKVIVEAGTFRGHTTMYLAQALVRNNLRGHIWTVDPVDRFKEVLDRNPWAKDRVTFINEPLEPWIVSFPFPVDLAFADAGGCDSPPETRWDTLIALLQRLTPFGLCVADDCAALPEHWLRVREAREIANIYLPSGRGLCIYQRRDR